MDCLEGLADAGDSAEDGLFLAAGVGLLAQLLHVLEFVLEQLYLKDAT